MELLITQLAANTEVLHSTAIFLGFLNVDEKEKKLQNFVV